MSESPVDTLRNAIARNSPAVLSLPAPEKVRHCKTRFLAELDGRIWIACDRNVRPLAERAMASANRVGMSFRANAARYIFTTSLLRIDPQLQLSEGLTVEALLVEFPSEVRVLQRRGNYRVRVPASSGTTVQVWKIPDHWVLRDKPPASNRIAAQIRDLSAGGMGLLIPARDGQPADLQAASRLRIVLKHGPYEVLLEGRVRHAARGPDQSLRIGVEFQRLDETLEGRQARSHLGRILADFQREEARRLRLGIET